MIHKTSHNSIISGFWANWGSNLMKTRLNVILGLSAKLLCLWSDPNLTVKKGEYVEFLSSLLKSWYTQGRSSENESENKCCRRPQTALFAPSNFIELFAERRKNLFSSRLTFWSENKRKLRAWSKELKKLARNWLSLILVSPFGMWLSCCYIRKCDNRESEPIIKSVCQTAKFFTHFTKNSISKRSRVLDQFTCQIDLDLWDKKGIPRDNFLSKSA